MKKLCKSLAFILGVCLLTAPWAAESVSAKSLYVLADRGSSNSPINSYTIENDGTLTFTKTINPAFGTNASGIACDSDTRWLFVTRTGSNSIYMVKADTEATKPAFATGATGGLGGIVFDPDAQCVYVVELGTDNLYAYDWNPAANPSLTVKDGFNPKNLGTQFNNSHGLELAVIGEEKQLHVTQKNNTVRYNVLPGVVNRKYSVGASAFNTQGITVDRGSRPNTDPQAYTGAGFLFTNGTIGNNSGDNGVGTRFFTLTSVFATYLDDLRARDLVIDQETGVLYLTTDSQKLLAFATPLSGDDDESDAIDNKGDIGNPTGVAICTGEEVECTIDSDCDDNLFCTGAETCVEGQCQDGTPVDCDDGVSCTDDSCNEDTDQCDNIPNDNNCPDDGQFCTGDEICDPVQDCISTGNPCDEGLICDEELEECVELDCIDDADCNDGLFCNGVETCVDNTCQSGTPPDCDDGVFCTDDSCNVETDQCDNVPSDNNCPDDELFCTGDEICDPIEDCISTGNPCDPPDSCDEETGTCIGETLCGDLDGNNDVDFDDYVIFMANFGLFVPPANPAADYDENGWIDNADFNIWFQCYIDFNSPPS